MLKSLDLPFEKRASDNMLTAGQPDAEQFRAAADAGVQHVINLRPVPEQGEDQTSMVEDLGMRYHHLPIASEHDLNPHTVAMLDGLLGEIGDKPTVFHCASGNRVGALLALRAAWHEGKSAEEALEIGRATGMTKLEPAVARLLQQGGPQQ